MKYEIKTINGDILFAGEYDSLKECVESAVKQKADLRGADLREADLREADIREADLRGAYLREADLRGADLRGAYLREADLRGADLREADLTGANLTGADLTGADLREADIREADLRGAYLREADLRGADLRGAYLREADLRGADLREADLTGANLTGAYLRGADLREADLTGANLTGAKGIIKERVNQLLFLLEQPGKIRLYKLVTSDYKSPMSCKQLDYPIKAVVSVDDACTDDNKECAAGVNVATLDWCLMNYSAGNRIMIVEFTAKDIACIPTATDGKLRLHKCKVVGEKDLTGLIPDNTTKEDSDNA